MPELPLALELGAAGDDTHERGFAQAVGAHHGHAVAAVHAQVHVVEHVIIAVRFGHFIQADNGFSGRAIHLEGERQPALGLGRFDAVQLVEHFDPALHLPGFRGLVSEALDKTLGAPDFALLVFHAVHEDFEPLLFFLLVV